MLLRLGEGSRSVQVTLHFLPGEVEWPSGARRCSVARHEAALAAQVCSRMVSDLSRNSPREPQDGSLSRLARAGSVHCYTTSAHAHGTKISKNKVFPSFLKVAPIFARRFPRQPLKLRRMHALSS